MLLVNGKKQEVLPELKKAVEFELVGGYTFEDPNLLTPSGAKYIRKNKTLRLPTHYVAFDKASNQNVEYRYAVRELPVSDGKGGYFKKYTPDRVVFSGTKLVCQLKDPDLYEFLVKSPWLERDGNPKPIFREMNPQKTAAYKIELETKRNKAKSLILDPDRMLSDVTLRRLLTSLGDDGDAYDIEVVKEKLLPVAEREPEKFLKLVGTKEPSAASDDKSFDRKEREAHLKELAKLLGDSNLGRGLHFINDENLSKKITEIEARWKEESTFLKLVSDGDAMAEAKNYEEAKGFYEDALNMKKNDKAVKDKLEKATKNLVPA